MIKFKSSTTDDATISFIYTSKKKLPTVIFLQCIKFYLIVYTYIIFMTWHGQSLLGEKFVWVVVGGGGGVEGNFSVSFGPNPGFKHWIWAWTKLNNICIIMFIKSLPGDGKPAFPVQPLAKHISSAVGSYGCFSP